MDELRPRTATGGLRLRKIWEEDGGPVGGGGVREQAHSVANVRLAELPGSEGGFCSLSCEGIPMVDGNCIGITALKVACWPTGTESGTNFFPQNGIEQERCGKLPSNHGLSATEGLDRTGISSPDE